MKERMGTLHSVSARNTSINYQNWFGCKLVGPWLPPRQGKCYVSFWVLVELLGVRGTLARSCLPHYIVYASCSVELPGGQAAKIELTVWSRVLS